MASVAVYPMVEEEEATGRVAAVYAAALETSPFVPSMLKSLAVCPAYLVLAWQQIAPVIVGDALADQAARLAASVDDAAAAPDDPRARRLLGRFVEPVARMLLVSCGLRAALTGELAGTGAASGEAPPAPAARLLRSIPTVQELPEAADTFARIRAALDTPIVNSVWRVAAAEGLLTEAWRHLEPQAPTTRLGADQLGRDALGRALDLPWQAVAGPASLRRTGVADAAPGIAAILDAYIATLPRVLTLIASSEPSLDDEASPEQEHSLALRLASRTPSE